MRFIFICASSLFLLCLIFGVVDAADATEDGCPGGCVMGRCIGIRCMCLGGYTGPFCQTPACSSGCGNGDCTGPNECTCKRGYSGPRCSRHNDMSSAYTSNNDMSSAYISNNSNETASTSYNSNETASTSSSTQLLLSDAVITVELKCGYSPASAKDVRGWNCFWKHPNGTHIQIQDIYESRHPEYSRPNNLTDNQCGIVLNSVSVGDVGVWTCVVPLQGRTLSETTELTFQNYTGIFKGFIKGYKVDLIIIGLGCLVVLLLLSLIITCLCCRKAPKTKVKEIESVSYQVPQQRKKSSHMYDTIDLNWSKSQTTKTYITEDDVYDW